MRELFLTLGIDWKLLIAQGINFGVVLVVLTFFVYRPLVAMMDERRKKIEKGLADAAAAEVRLKEIADERKITLRKAEKEGQILFDKIEEQAKAYKIDAMKRADDEASRTLKEASEQARKQKEEELEKLKGQAGSVIALAIGRAVSEDPAKVDKALIGRATEILKKELRAS